MSDGAEKLALLRAALKQNSIDAYIITNTDPHLNEEIPDHWKILRWLTGFTGSAATVVITDSFAGLWTDSRYLLQASGQIKDSGFGLIKSEGYIEWLSENVTKGGKIALDGRIFSARQFKKIGSELADNNIELDPGYDLISTIWSDRPAIPEDTVYDHKTEFSGKERALKIDEVRQQMKRLDVDYQLLNAPDDIMWLLNIRGNDLKYSPLLLSFALVGLEQILLFANENKIPKTLKTVFDSLNIVILPYEEIGGMLSTLGKDSVILLSPDNTSVEIYFSLPAGMKKIEDTSIPSKFKAVKNKIEIENIGKTMIKDGVSLTKFFHFVEVSSGKVPMTELSLVGKLHEYRKMQEDFTGESFSSILAINEHAAFPHYSPSLASDIQIEEGGLLLVDSGGQYYGGTTDITRTVILGKPKPGQIKDFTLVLKGHINLALAKFPHGTKGYQLDILARKALWEHGLNYGHGTGHGVGYFLNVHEGPQNISPGDNKTIIEPGMLISNEPAIYREEEYGIRTENLVICYEDEETEFGQFLKFDTVSLCYIDKKLIDKSLLNDEEILWLNSYHAEVFDKLSPFLSDDEKIWLKDKTSPL